MICLCSGSESRALLLREAGQAFIQRTVDFDEERISTDSACAFVYMASKGKLEAAIVAYGLELPLLCADTVIVAADGSILRKAKSREDARRILMKQSGSRISILSSIHFRTQTLLFTDIAATHYTFAPFDEEELETYLQSGDWEGKAGGCMVEGFCKQYIRTVDGYESTATGLQTERLLPWIDASEHLLTASRDGL